MFLKTVQSGGGSSELDFEAIDGVKPAGDSAIRINTSKKAKMVFLGAYSNGGSLSGSNINPTTGEISDSKFYVYFNSREVNLTITDEYILIGPFSWSGSNTPLHAVVIY